MARHVVVDSERPRSPGWWLARLLGRLDERAKDVTTRWDYYEGRHPKPWLHDYELAPQFDRLQLISRTNYAALTIQAVEERLDIEGFRFGDSNVGDELAWKIWQANDLDELSQVGNLSALVADTAYTLTWPNAQDGTPDIWVEDALNVIHEFEPGTRRVTAAVKAWHDDLTGHDRAEVYLRDQPDGAPSGIYRFVRESSKSTGRWEPFDDGRLFNRFEPLPDQYRRLSRAGLVPLVPLMVNPDTRHTGRSDLLPVEPIQDRINQTTFDRMVAQHYSSFQQVVGIGVEPEYDPETNQPVNPLKRNPAQTWLIEAGGDVKTIDPANLDEMIKAVDQDVAAMARVAAVPPSYLSSKMEFPSGDAIKFAEKRLVEKCRRRTRQLGGGYELTMRYAFAAAGELERARVVDVETIWRDVEIRTEGELVDALVKMSTLGVPQEVLWERWGASQVEIARWRRQTQAARLLSAARPEPPAVPAA